MPIVDEDEDDETAFEEIVLNGRMCIVSRRSLPAAELIRFVAAPDGQVVADLKRRLPGRGAHVEATRRAVELAVKRNLFRRALKAEVVGTGGLGDAVDAALVRSALGFLGLARKAGELATGSAKVEAAIRSGRAAALLHAADAAADGVRKLDGARRATEAATGAEAVPVFRSFSSAELGLALGGGNVIHAAVLSGEAGSALVKRLRALANYRGESPGAMSGEAAGAARRDVAPKH